MTRDERGYVTVEHAVCFVAVTLVIGILVAAGQAGQGDQALGVDNAGVSYCVAGLGTDGDDDTS